MTSTKEAGPARFAILVACASRSNTSHFHRLRGFSLLTMIVMLPYAEDFQFVPYGRHSIDGRTAENLFCDLNMLARTGKSSALWRWSRRHLDVFSQASLVGTSRSAAAGWNQSLNFLSRSSSSSAAASDDPIYAEEPLPETGEWAGCKRSFMQPLRVGVRGSDILYNPLFNKGTAFKSGERDRLRLRGLLPSRIMNIHLQKERFLLGLRAETSNIKKNLMLEDLHDRNETLYFRVLVDHIDEMAPLIYTPTVGQACLEFAARYRRPRGMYFTEEDRANMAAMVSASLLLFPCFVVLQIGQHLG